MPESFVALDTKTRRYCPHCDQSKPFEEFAPNRYVKSGRSRICHSCDAKKRRAYIVKNRSVVNQRQNDAYHAPKRLSGLTREEYLRRLTCGKYNLTVEEFHALLEKQNHHCAICQRLFDLSNGYRNCHIDHSNIDGRVRGLLCNSCNNGIGRFEHDPERLRNAADYLETANEKRIVSGQLGLSCAADDLSIPSK